MPGLSGTSPRRAFKLLHSLPLFLLLALLAVATGCAGGRPGVVRGGGWEVAFESLAPDDPQEDSLYLELLDNDALDEGFVELAVQLHRMRPRVVRASGAVAYRERSAGVSAGASAAGEPSRTGATRGGRETGGAGASQEPGQAPVGWIEWEEGWYFERCRAAVEYDVDAAAGRIDYEVGVEAMGLVGRLLTGSCEGARDTGRLLVLRFELLRPGAVVFEMDPDGRTGFDSTGGEGMSYGRVYGGTLTIRRIR